MRSRPSVPAARPPVWRAILRTRITTYGERFATTHVEFQRVGSERIGRQTQTWLKLPEGWRVVSAHVSLMA